MIKEETYTPSCQVPFLKDVFQQNWGEKQTGNPGNRGFYPGEQQEAPPDGCCVIDLESDLSSAGRKPPERCPHAETERGGDTVNGKQNIQYENVCKTRIKEQVAGRSDEEFLKN